MNNRKLFDKLTKTGRAYARLFDQDNPDVKIIIKDLAEFSRYNRPLVAPDELDKDTMLLREGQRILFLHILSKINFDEEKLKELFND